MLARGVALSGALRLSDAPGDSSQWQLASIRLPLARQASVTLERSWWTGSSDDGSINALTVQLPFDPSAQPADSVGTDRLPAARPAIRFDNQGGQTTASYTPGPWGSLNYQQSTQWFDNGRMQQWNKVSWMVHLADRPRGNSRRPFRTSPIHNDSGLA